MRNFTGNIEKTEYTKITRNFFKRTPISNDIFDSPNHFEYAKISGTRSIGMKSFFSTKTLFFQNVYQKPTLSGRVSKLQKKENERELTFAFYRMRLLISSKVA